MKRDFAAEAINQKWYGDGTEIPAGESKPHLASVLDVGSSGGVIPAGQSSGFSRDLPYFICNFLAQSI